GCAEVRHTITFVERLVHAIETNKCVQYDVNKSFVYAVDATTQVLDVMHRFKEFNFFQLVAENLSKFKKQQFVPYITSDPEMLQYWSHAKVVPAEASAAMDIDEPDERKEAEDVVDGEVVLTEEDSEHSDDDAILFSAR